MKKADKYSKIRGGGYLTEDERKDIDTLVNKICDNHDKDHWWKIEGSIFHRVNYVLGCRLADEAFAEMTENYKEEDE